MSFVCLLLEEASRDPGLFASVTTGTLVVELRRVRWTAELVLGADDGRAFTELSACQLPFIAFDEITRFVTERSADFGGAFVLVSDDSVCISVLAELDLDDAQTRAPEPRVLAASLFDDAFDQPTTLAPRWDVDATVICAPPVELLAGLR